jgi:hypothetical protein
MNMSELLLCVWDVCEVVRVDSMSQVFIGVGPKGHSVTEGQLSTMVSRIAGGATLDWRGGYAIASVATQADADALIGELNGKTVNEVRLVARMDRGSSNGAGYRSNVIQGTRGPVQLYVGLGPNGRSVTQDALQHAVKSIVRGRVDAVMHQHFAIVTVADEAAAQATVDGLQNTYIGDVRLSLRRDRQQAQQQRPGVAPRQFNGAPNDKRVYVGLGPNATQVGVDALRQVCEELAPVLSIRMARACAFVDVTEAEHSQALIDGLNGTTLHGCRLVVRLCRD